MSFLSKQTEAKILKELPKYPTKQAAVKSALRYAQDEHGWVSDEVIQAVAELLELETIQVYEVATFYDHFDTRPVGRHRIKICTNISCMLLEAEEIADYIKKKLKINYGETSADGKFTLYEAECLAACCGAPMMMIGNDYHEFLTPKKVDQILDGLN